MPPSCTLEYVIAKFEAGAPTDERCIYRLYRHLHADRILSSGDLQIMCYYCSHYYTKYVLSECDSPLLALHRTFRCTACRRTHTLLSGTSLQAVRNNLREHIKHRLAIKYCKDHSIPVRRLAATEWMDMRLMRRILAKWSAVDDFDMLVFMK